LLKDTKDDINGNPERSTGLSVVQQADIEKLTAANDIGISAGVDCLDRESVEIRDDVVRLMKTHYLSLDPGSAVPSVCIIFERTFQRHGSNFGT